LRSIIPVVALGVCALAGCSNNTPKPPGTSSSPTATQSPSPPTASPTGTSGALPAYCESYAKLKASIQALTQLSPNSGITGIQTALNNIQTNLNEFTAAAHSQFGPQVTQLRSALDNLKKAVQVASATPNSANISAAATAAGGVVSGYTALQTAIGNRCG